MPSYQVAATAAVVDDTAELAILKGPPTWSRVDDHTLKFTGEFSSSDHPTLLEGFNAIYRAGDSMLVVDSGGGSVESGLELGQRLAPLRMTVAVDGVCGSSCANYIFTAGAQKQIRRGWVGFHGNAKAMFTVGWGDLVAGLQAHQKELNQPPFTEEQLTEIRQQQAPLVQSEASFLASLGVEQALFDRSQADDKGMGDGKDYVFLCPSPATFLRYGIKNVSGQQDMSFLSSKILNILD